MSYYKIKNITSKLPKRHINKDMNLKIEYHVGFQKKFHALSADNEIVLSCRKLPVSIHSLRTKQLITVIEISENEFVRLQKPSARKEVVKKEKVPTNAPKKEIILDETKVVLNNTSKKKNTPKKKIESTVTIKED